MDLPPPAPSRRPGLAWRVLAYWAPPLAFMGLIFLVSSLPMKKVPLVWDFQDKVVHFFEYFVLAFLAARAASGPDPTPPPWRIAAALAATLAFGLVDEVHQSFVPGRHGSGLDLLADAFGVLAGGLTWTLLVNWRASRLLQHDIIATEPDAEIAGGKGTG